ncbi:hypothetical protein [Nitratiruptor sp. YY09-18]|uniref:hypothetical protein n=1 Tax=Nitratiruptor sp. YY09-18 TaxID=2724901 RepID=UPI001915E194|nr:hypothetical protein [Nitratiruptor sp. YY09-18]BCD68876.1 hypothetical protein NitYY0918_C1795 [Nitratiruptor sp. YY09-18]
MRLTSIIVSSLLLSSTLLAHESEAVQEHEKPYYIVLKGIHNFGDTYRDEKGDHVME